MVKQRLNNRLNNRPSLPTPWPRLRRRHRLTFMPRTSPSTGHNRKYDRSYHQEKQDQDNVHKQHKRTPNQTKQWGYRERRLLYFPRERDSWRWRNRTRCAGEDWQSQNNIPPAFLLLRPVWRSKEISLRTKLRIFNTNVKSVLMYGAETWRVTKKISAKIQAFTNRCLRNILGVR